MAMTKCSLILSEGTSSTDNERYLKFVGKKFFTPVDTLITIKKIIDNYKNVFINSLMT